MLINGPSTSGTRESESVSGAGPAKRKVIGSAAQSELSELPGHQCRSQALGQPTERRGWGQARVSQASGSSESEGRLSGGDVTYWSNRKGRDRIRSAELP
jgi:hypothetical protein